ncbi:hypothetical protein GOBAR_AA15929 [Gossypium barbadense]|uniref:KIB1-4 beta-propeller domain-containing protein n=1 Tax=Gossypium barbadense TaxID=3634 RepID=A0A2P5XN08_GOSBA|nr:hypothetical protein GOBAR_AA15929 [Gossypium barbadense]
MAKCRFSTAEQVIPDELIDARIFFSNYGWLLMCQDTRLFFFHPFTNQRIDLPNIQRHTLEEYGRMCFSTPPTSPNCMVFGILDDSPTVSDVTIIHRGESSWPNIRYKTNNVRFYTSHGNPVFYKGAFYCLGIDGKLGIFDPSKRGRRCWKIIDKLKHPCDSIQENFLVESNGELISICMGHIGEYVRVFRLNYHYEIRWEEVQNLGDEMIFASRTGSMCLRTHSMGNTIYFPNFDNGGNGLFYSLASRKFHSLGVALPRKDLYNTKRMLHCAWITPTALEVYRDDELRWFPNRENFIPSSGRVTVVGAPHTHPSFVLTNLEHSNNQLVFNMFNTPHNAKRILEVRQMRTVKCAFGWLFQVDWGYSDCLLINPQSMEKINLPRLPKIFDKCVISSSPKDPSCIVLLIDYYSFENGSRVDFIYCRPGESEWTIVTVSSSSDESQNSTDSDNEEDEEEEVYGLELKLPLATSLGTVDNKIYMVESCDEIFVVRINLRGECTENASKITEVEVFKLSLTRKIWEKVGCLGENIAFFCYGDSCCVVSSCMEKGKGNCIYFIDSFPDDENVYAFDFEDGSISVSLPFPEVDMNGFEWTALTLS